MFDSATICRHLHLAIKLSECLSEVYCHEGAKMIGDEVSSCLSLISDQNGGRLTEANVDFYVNFIVFLEDHPATSNPERFSSFVSVFSKLKPSIQCQLVLDMESERQSRWKSLSSYSTFFNSLCAALSSCHVFKEPIQPEKIVSTIQLFVKLGNPEWIQAFVCSLIESPDLPIPEYDYYSGFHGKKKGSIEKIVESPIIWDLATSSEFGKLVLTTLMDHLISELKVEDPLPYSIRADNQKTVTTYLKMAMKMERSPTLAKKDRITSLVSKTTNFDFDELGGILVDISKSNSDRLNKHPSSIAFFELIYREVSTRLVNEKYLSSKSRLKVLLCFLQLLGIQSVSRMVEVICHQVSTGDGGETQIFFAEMVESAIWKELESPVKLLVLKTCSTLIEYSVTSIARFMVLKGFSETYFEESLVLHLSLFFFIEKNRSDPKQKNLSVDFQKLFVELSIDSMMKVVLQIYLKEVSAIPNIKKFPICFDLYRKMCRVFLKRNFLSLTMFETENSDQIVNLLKCLVWLSDSEAWQLFSSRICKSIGSLVQSCLAVILPQQSDLWKTIANSPPALEAIAKIAEYADRVSNNSSKPVFSWHQPWATVPGHPKVQKFLRSASQTLSYSEFRGIGEARQFADLLDQLEIQNKFSVTTETEGVGRNACCIIKKDPSHNDLAERNRVYQKVNLKDLILLKSKLASLRDPITDLTIGSTVSSEIDGVDDIVIVPPNKRIKPDVPVVELQD